ncbi:hypothetical protein LINGRAPRIM_LOCUS2565 [Linum grandiflorum]
MSVLELPMLVFLIGGG